MKEKEDEVKPQPTSTEINLEKYTVDFKGRTMDEVFEAAAKIQREMAQKKKPIRRIPFLKVLRNTG